MHKLTHLQLAKARIDYKQNSINGERRLRNVRSNNTFAHTAGRLVKDLRL
jgi:hypothetical protein